MQHLGQCFPTCGFPYPRATWNTALRRGVADREGTFSFMPLLRETGGPDLTEGHARPLEDMGPCDPFAGLPASLNSILMQLWPTFAFHCETRNELWPHHGAVLRSEGAVAWLPDMSGFLSSGMILEVPITAKLPTLSLSTTTWWVPNLWKQVKNHSFFWPCPT